MPIIANLTRRRVKGSRLTHDEVDDNWDEITARFLEVPDPVTANSPDTHGVQIVGNDVQEKPYSQLPAA